MRNIIEIITTGEEILSGITQIQIFPGYVTQYLTTDLR